jgi:hypothetical protein
VTRVLRNKQGRKGGHKCSSKYSNDDEEHRDTVKVCGDVIASACRAARR